MRYLTILLFVIVLAAPFAMRKAVISARPSAPGNGTGTERLVVITPHNPDIRNEFSRAFREWHRSHYGNEVELDYRVPGGTSDVKRQLDATYRAYRHDGKLAADVPADISVAWGGGDFFMDQELKPLGVLLPLPMTGALLKQFRESFPAPTLAGVKLYDASSAGAIPTPQWIGVCLSSFGICYNPDVYSALGLPEPSPEKGWSELTDPKLAGRLSLADPAHSGSSAVAYQMVIQHKMAEAEAEFLERNPAFKAMKKADLSKNPEYRQAIAAGWKNGMGELLKIAANARYFSDSSTLVPMDVSRGEAAAGVAIDFYARVTQESVGPGRMRFIAPIGATAITPDPVAVLYGTKGRKLELSQHFIEFLLSIEGQRLWMLKPHTPGGPTDRALRRMPIRPDVYGDRSDWADDVDPFQTAKGFNQRGEWMALFTDSRPIWVAAWIDSRDALKDAYDKVLRVQDTARRRALIDQLADLPIQMSDVENLKAERKRREQSRDELDEWRAMQQIGWAERFRKHYRQVGDAAH